MKTKVRVVAVGVEYDGHQVKQNIETRPIYHDHRDYTYLGPTCKGVSIEMINPTESIQEVSPEDILTIEITKDKKGESYD